MTPTPAPRPDFVKMWRNLRSAGKSPDVANDIVHEHMRKYGIAITPEKPAQNPVATALTQFGHGASFGFAGDPDYLATGEAANPTTASVAGGIGTVAGATALTGNPVATTLMSGLTPAAASAVGGGAVGGLEAAGHDSSVPIGIAGGAGLGWAGGKVIGKFLPTGRRLAANILKLLGRTGTVKGLQSVADAVGREAAPEVAGAMSKSPDLNAADVEELHHILNGEPTIPGYQTTNAWIGHTAPSPVPGAAPTVLTEAAVRSNIQEATVIDLADKLQKYGGVVDPERAAALARAYVAKAGQAAAKDVTMARTPLAPGSTGAMQVQAPLPTQVKPDVEAQIHVRMGDELSQQKAAHETTVIRALMRSGLNAEDAKAMVRSASGEVPTGVQAAAAQVAPPKAPPTTDSNALIRYRQLQGLKEAADKAGDFRKAEQYHRVQQKLDMTETDWKGVGQSTTF